MIAILAWIALAFEMSGNWFIGDKHRWGFLVKIAGSVSWLIVAVMCSVDGLIASAIMGMIISARCYKKWGRKK